MLEKINTPAAPAAIGPYTQAVISKGFLFTSGQIPLDPVTGAVSGTSIEEQAIRVMENIAAVLKAAGTDFDKVVKTTCFLSDMGNFSAFNSIYARYFVSCPARSCIAVRSLPKDVLLEVEAIAEL